MWISFPKLVKNIKMLLITYPVGLIKIILFKEQFRENNDVLKTLEVHSSVCSVHEMILFVLLTISWDSAASGLNLDQRAQTLFMHLKLFTLLIIQVE